MTGYNEITQFPRGVFFKDGLSTTVNYVSGIAASQLLVITGAPSNTQTVTIDGKAYTFQTVLTDVDGNVLIGASATTARDNLKSAINLEPGHAGVEYAASMTRHTSCVAEASGADLRVRAISRGTGGNSIAVSETATNYAWAAATLSGGSGESTEVRMCNAIIGGGAAAEIVIFENAAGTTEFMRVKVPAGETVPVLFGFSAPAGLRVKTATAASGLTITIFHAPL
jgi:hypothetical protein